LQTDLCAKYVVFLLTEQNQVTHAVVATKIVRFKMDLWRFVGLALGLLFMLALYLLWVLLLTSVVG
jgi:hypothetical protein